MTIDLQKFLRTRRSIRHFRLEPVPESILKQILETATYAPSAHDKQPWRFVVLTTSEAKSRLAKAITGKFLLDMTKDGISTDKIRDRLEQTIRRINEAPVIIILCRDITQINFQPNAPSQQAEETMGVQSVAVAGLQLLLSAHAEGLGATWICWPLFAAEELSKALDLPSDWKPQGMVFLGYPDEEPSPSSRKPIQEIVRYL